jgi:hypothetical protein
MNTKKRPKYSLEGLEFLGQSILRFLEWDIVSVFDYERNFQKGKIEADRQVKEEDSLTN